MARKDIISKRLLKRILLDMANHLFQLELIDATLLTTEHQRIEDRRADLIASVTTVGHDRFILHLEIQNNNDPTMPVRMLRYLTDIKLAHTGQRIHQCLLYIGAQPLTMARRLDSPQLSYQYDLIDMREIDYQALYNSDNPDALVLAILCDFRGREPTTIVTAILQKLHKLTEGDEKRHGEYLQILEILADNRALNINIQEAYDMLHIEIERLPSYQKGMLKGEQRGEKRGEKRGEQRGEQKGEQKGLQKKAEEIAQKLLALGFATDQIASITGLTPADIERLK